MWLGADKWQGVIHPKWIDAKYKKAFTIVESKLQIIQNEYRQGVVYPSKDNIFKAFEMNPDDIKVVILGQDPYHNGAATGLAFDVDKNSKMQPSLRRILEKIKLQTGEERYKDNPNTYLEHLPPQGVFLLNTALTVKEKAPASHLGIWEEFTKEIIASISKKPVVFILWGKKALAYKPYISNPSVTLEGAHPSPFTREKFFESDEFSKINTIQW